MTQFSEVPSMRLVDADTDEAVSWQSCPAASDVMCTRRYPSPADRQTVNLRLDLVRPNGGVAATQGVSVTKHSPWFALNYEPRRPDEDWYTLAQFNPNACTDKPSGTECHEWPWAATHQGGDPRTHEPAQIPKLTPLAVNENRTEGRKYQTFLTRCGVATRYQATGDWNSTPFLTTPQLLRPSFAVCAPQAGG